MHPASLTQSRPAEPPAERATERRGDGAVLTVRGEIDLASAPNLERALLGAVTGDPPRLIVDLHDVTFMDCSGLGALIRAHDRFRVAGGDLRLQRVPEQVVRLLELTGTADLFGLSRG